MKSNKSASSGRIALAIVSDHSALSLGLAQILNGEKDIRISGTFDFQAAPVALAKLKPDVVLVDISIRTVAGIELIKEIAYDPQSRLVAVNLNGEDTFATRAIKSGAKGYLTKDLEKDLATAVRRVANGSLFVSDTVAQAMVATLASLGTNPVAEPIELLSDRELEIAELVGRGMTNEQISKQTGITVRTVETHKQHMKVKMGISNGAQLNRYCVEWFNSRHSARKLS